MTKISIGIDADGYATATFTDSTRSKTIRSDEPVPPGDTMRVRLVRGPHDAPRIEVESADPMTTADRGDTT